MVLYRSSTDPDSIQELTVNVPNPAKEIRTQGLEILKGWEKVTNAERRRSQDMLEALRENTRMEEVYREKAYDQDLKNRELINNSVLANLDRKRKNLEIKRNETAKNYERLGDIARSATTIAKTIRTDQKKNIDKEMDTARHRLDAAEISWSEVEELRTLEKAGYDSKLKRDDLFKNLSGKLGPDGEDFLLDLIDDTGYRKRSLQRSFVRNLPIQNLVEERNNKKYNIGGTEISRAEALAAGNYDLYKQLGERIFQEIRSEQTASGLVSDKDWKQIVAPKYRQLTGEANKKLQKLKRDKILKNARNSDREVTKNRLLTVFENPTSDIPGHTAYDKSVHVMWQDKINNPKLTSSRSSRLDGMTADFSLAISEGDLPIEFGKALLDYEVEINGKKVKFKDQWGNRADSIRSAITARNKKDLAAIDAEKKRLEGNSQKRINSFTRDYKTETKDMTPAQTRDWLENRRNLAVTQRHTKLAQKINAAIAVDPLSADDDKLEDELQWKFNRGLLHKTDIDRAPFGDEELRGEWYGKLKNQVIPKNVERVIGENGTIRTMLGARVKYNFGKKTGTHTLDRMWDKAVVKYLQDVADYGEEKAIGYFKGDLGTDPYSGEYAITKAGKGDTHFVNGMITAAARPKRIALDDLKKEIKNNPKYLEEVFLLEDKQMLDILDARVRGKSKPYPTKISDIRKVTWGKDEEEIFQMQLQAYRKKLRDAGVDESRIPPPLAEDKKLRRWNTNVNQLRAEHGMPDITKFPSRKDQEILEQQVDNKITNKGWDDDSNRREGLKGIDPLEEQE